MKGAVLTDTGPLVALLNRREAHHKWATAQFSQIRPPALTCEAVVSEACFLLQHVNLGVESLLELLKRGVIAIPFNLQDEQANVQRMIARYRNVPMSLADACLVRMAEQFSESTVLTLDHHFLVYRKNGRLVIPIIMPSDETK